MSDTVIELQGVTFAYPGGTPVLTGADLQLQAGERLGLIGSNGSGKTTILHLLVGLLRATGGEIRLLGQACRSEADFAAARRRIGLLFQDPDDQLFCTTVEEDLAFGPFNLGLTRAEVQTRVDRVLATLDIEHLRERVTYRLSEGEKRLVSLGTLLTMDPAVLLLDEPSNGLDDQARERLIALLAGLPQALLIVSHDHDLLARLAPRRLRIRAGKMEPA